MKFPRLPSGGSGVPLSHDATSRFLPWIVGLMVYLSALALAGALIVGAATARWKSELSGSVTVELPYTDGKATSGEIEGLLDLIRSTAGIASAELISADQARALLEPWLGRGAALDDLPLPRLIDIRLTPGERPDLAALAVRVKGVVADAELDDHQLWLDKLLALATAVRALALAILAMVSVAAAWSVIFATRTRLDIHWRVVEVLHLIGAKDSYIARQFQLQALWLGLGGGLIGLSLAALTLLGLQLAGDGAGLGLMPNFGLNWRDWSILTIVPVATAAIATLTARVTVLRILRKMP